MRLPQGAKQPLLLLIPLAILFVGLFQSWNVALSIVLLSIISSIMALGVNIQWGYAGIFNAGIMGFAALGGLSAIVISMPPVGAAWAAAGSSPAKIAAILVGSAVAIVSARAVFRGRSRLFLTLALTALALALLYVPFTQMTEAVEAVDPAATGYLGGLGLPIALSWLVGAIVAAGVAYFIAKVALGLSSDYLAIATLGIAEIVVALLKNEAWLSRGVKNVAGLPRPVPFEAELTDTSFATKLAGLLGTSSDSTAAITVKLIYIGYFATILMLLFVLAEIAWKSPWGRTMRAIRDNINAAQAMGKDTRRKHIQVFVVGSAIVGMAGAMLTTLDGQFTPGSYQPLRFTFLIWVMVIVGGSGNNFGSVVGAFVIWFVWIEAEPIGNWLMTLATSWLPSDNPIADHLIKGAPYLRLILMGLILTLTLRLMPNGLLPERQVAISANNRAG